MNALPRLTPMLVVLFLATVPAAAAEPLTPEEARTLVAELLRRHPSGNSGSHNEAIRNASAWGFEAALSDPAVLDKFEMALSQPDRRGVCQSAIQAIGSLRLCALDRLSAVRAAYLLDPQSELPGRWIKGIVETRAYAMWADHEHDSVRREQ